MGSLKDDMKNSMNSMKNAAEVAAYEATFAAKLTGSLASEGAKEVMNVAGNFGKKTVDTAKDITDSISDRVKSAYNDDI